jgi:hypothetical protein
MIEITINSYSLFIVIYLVYSLISLFFISKGEDKHLGRNMVLLLIWGLATVYFVIKLIIFLYTHIHFHLI